ERSLLLLYNKTPHLFEQQSIKSTKRKKLHSNERNFSELCFINPVILGNLGDSYFTRVQLMINPSAVGERNILVPFTLDKRFRGFLRFSKNKAADIMLFVEEI